MPLKKLAAKLGATRLAQDAATPRPTVGLALSGGSTLGIAHIGAIKALEEAGIPIDYISGTSAGSLVAGCYAFGMPPERMADVTKTLDWRKLSRFAYSRLGVRSNKPMEAFLIGLLGDVDMDDARIPLSIVATDIVTREKVVLRHSRLVDAIRASTCIPGYFTPVEVNGRLLVDGWLTENLPLSPLRELGAEVVIGINLTSNPPQEAPQSLLDVVGISMSMLARQRDRHYLDGADILIEPELSQFDSSRFAAVEQIMEEGYRATKAAIPAIQAKLSEKPKKSDAPLMPLARLIGKVFGTQTK